MNVAADTNTTKSKALMEPDTPMHEPSEVTTRHVSAQLNLTVWSEADIVAAVAVADGPTRTSEALVIELDQQRIDPIEISTGHGGRIHMLRAVSPGRLTIEYRATIHGSAPTPAARPIDAYQYARPSRFCQSDQLGPIARSEFAGLSGRELLDAVSSWVGANVAYLPGSSRPTDGAVTTMLSRAGVCRDFAHLAAALLRANGVPARVASVYAPGLVPMDFHAVAEACIDGCWWVVDPTTLAPRSSLLRIATGVDATDTAFLTTLRGSVDMDGLQVSAIVEPWLPTDDLTELVTLS